MPNKTHPHPTDTDDLLIFYSDAIVVEMMKLDQRDADTITEADTAHIEFCSHITDRIHLQTLWQWLLSDNQGIRFAGHLGLQEYREMMTYECWS